MILARIRVTGTCAVLTEWKEIPKGIRGAEVAIVYEDPTWDSLQKTVVFKGCVIRDVVNAGEFVTIPPECVERAGAPLKVGIYGTDADNNLAIPTLWADLGRVRDATDPSGDESIIEALPVWAQILAVIGDLDDLATDAKNTLVAAINEAATKGGGSVSEEEVWAIVDRYLQEHPPVFAETDPTVPSWAKQPQKPSYSAQEVGAEPAGTAAAAVSGHNTAADAHNDIRLELKAINDRLTAFFDSDDKTLDELSEIVAYITSNKSLIDAITTSKVSVSDIINNLTTNAANRPLSAAQGVVLKGLIDAVSSSLSGYQPKGDYLGREELPAAVNDALAQAKASGEFKGDPGTPGKDGVDGKPGSDGLDGADGITPHIGNNGNWYIGTTDTGKPSQGTPGKNGADGINGKDGYTPRKNVDYFDGEDGKDGVDGKDGTSVTVKSVSESTADGGSNVVTFSDGKTLTVKNGSKGSTGATGATGATGERGETGKTAYEYAKDGGYTGTEAQFAEKLAAEFPTELPNPAALTINGNRYDGSKSLFLDVQERKFYELPGAVLVTNASVTSGQYAWINYNAVDGYEEITVVYDGVTYVSPIKFVKDITGAGDESYFYFGNWNNSAPKYPFFGFGYINWDYATVNVGSGSHTVSVVLEPFVKKIDKKFIPDDIGGGGSGGGAQSEVFFPEAEYPLDDPTEISSPDAFASFTGVVEVGQNYSVSFDGKKYNCVGKTYEHEWIVGDYGENFAYIGNLALFVPWAGYEEIINTEEVDTGEPFFFFVQNPGTGEAQLLISEAYGASGSIVFGINAVSGGSGGAPSDWLADEGEPGHILNRPFYPYDEPAIDPYFSGNLSERPVLPFGDGVNFAKITDYVLTEEECVGKVVEFVAGAQIQSVTVTEDQIMDITEMYGLPCFMVGELVLVVREPGVVMGLDVSAGTYYMHLAADGLTAFTTYFSALPERDSAKKLDPMFLPPVGANEVPFTFSGMDGHEGFHYSGGYTYFVATSKMKKQMQTGTIKVAFNIKPLGESEYSQVSVVLTGDLQNAYGGFEVASYTGGTVRYDVALRLATNVGFAEIVVSPLFHSPESIGCYQPIVRNANGVYSIGVDADGNVKATKL